MPASSILPLRTTTRATYRTGPYLPSRIVSYRADRCPDDAGLGVDEVVDTKVRGSARSLPVPVSVCLPIHPS